MADTELVIFDFDGVVVDSEVISARMLVAELAQHGVDVDLPYIAEHFLGRSYPVVLAQVRSAFGITLPEGFEADYRARLVEAFRHELRVMAGLRDFVTSLAVPYCIATSSSPARVAQSIEIAGLGDLFDGRITTASEVTRGKPAPDLPLRAGLAARMTVWQFTGGSHFAGMVPPASPDATPHRTFAEFPEVAHFAPQLLKPAMRESRTDG